MPVPERSPISFLGLGNSLAEARLVRGLDLRDVERETRIRARYLSALEQERFDALPGDAYGRVFVRTYAAYLGLDADAYAEEYRRRRGERREPVAPAPSAAPSARSRAPIVVGAAVLVAAAAAALALTLGLREGAAPAPPPAPPPAAPTAARPVATSVAITASRGETEMTVRFGGPAGRTVWEGTLRRGRTMRFGLSRPLWISIGSPRSVEVRRGEERVRVGAGPLLLSSS